MNAPQVSLVVVPREKFSYARASLESIYQHTDVPFELIYVDGGSPRGERRYLESQAQERGFTLIRCEAYLSPNQSRNLGLTRVRTPYVVFIDNDVVVTPGWLGPLLKCAEDTGAAIVSPIICQGEPVHTVIHCAGGICEVADKTDQQGTTRRILREHIGYQGRKLADTRTKLSRGETQLAEFHCMLVTTAIFSAVGRLDERLRNTREHIDFCIAVRQAGGKIVLEVDSVVTYVHNSDLVFKDLGFYLVRWSDKWQQQSLQRMAQKWELTVDENLHRRFGSLGWRRRTYVLRPLSRRLTMGIGGKYLAGIVYRLLVFLDVPTNRLLSALNERRVRQALAVNQQQAVRSEAL